MVLERPFPTFPHGFPAADDRRVRGAHRPARCWATSWRRAPRSSTSSAPEHMRTGAPIVYTSADSVFQIAAHEDVVPLAHAVRVVSRRLRDRGRGRRARPRHRPAVRRRRRARSPAPPTGTTTRCRRRGETLLDRLTAARASGHRDRQDQRPVRGPRHRHARSRRPATTMAWTCCRRALATSDRGLLFANLVDFDTLYGHRNDVGGLRAQPRALRRAAGRPVAGCSARTICW